MPETKEIKRLKDPVYGYVEIPVEYMTSIIDTAEFQRLRRIMQTSYSPLYSSAVHNRFVHSIGVFYLGSIVSERLVDEVTKKGYLNENEIRKLVHIYKLACLLHDVGHAPFSHTGECFYKNLKFKSIELHNRIGELVGSDTFRKEIIAKETKPAAPHELMSVIIGIKNYGELIGGLEEKEFFARCITGYVYETNGIDEKTGEEKKLQPIDQIKNCLIGLLNSKVIDVDRLDYLVRDAYISGFETVNIDYRRLLNAVTIVFHNEKYQVAYKKHALSIIENVVYAHDAEKKWIQNHPVVLYEAYILKHIIMNLNNKLSIMNEDGEVVAKLFSEQALSQEGVVLKDNVKVSLLCDDDVIYLYKNKFQDELSGEFLDRNNRRHPLWKSEAEYKGYITELGAKGGKLEKKFDEFVEGITKGAFKDIPSFSVINEQYISGIKEELESAQKALEVERRPMKKQSIENNIKGIKGRLVFGNKLHEYAQTNGIDTDFVVLSADIFNSNFSKDYLKHTLVVFEDGQNENVFEIKQVCPILQAPEETGKMFYIFYRKKENVRICGIKDFCEDLFLKTVSAK